LLAPAKAKTALVPAYLVATTANIAEAFDVIELGSLWLNSIQLKRCPLMDRSGLSPALPVRGMMSLCPVKLLTSIFKVDCS
jgi:hypothetical protein